MPQTRKKVSDAIVSVMSDGANGFNAKWAATRATYGVGAVTFDWTAPSTSVFIGGVSPNDADRTLLSDRVTLRIATGASQWSGETRFAKWSGFIEAALDFEVHRSHQVRDDDFAEADDVIEDYLGCIEDVVIEIFMRAAIDWASLGVVLARPPECPAAPEVELLEDGWKLLVPIRIGFKVDAN